MGLQSLKHGLLTGGGEPLAEPTADPFQQPWKAEGTPAACLASGPLGLLAPLTLNSCLFICCTQCCQVTFFTDKPLGLLLLNLQNSFYKI